MFQGNLNQDDDNNSSRSRQDQKLMVPKIGFSRIEAAQALGISPNSLDRLAARGLIRPSRALRRPIYSLEDLTRFLDETK